ncbi:Secreted protein [Phytophthora megakarya]|uniref:Secreted protein n=1 Tax=Phytophthora megakarya TaxID=4795 RepID=A0A225V4W5_9STRA|nr:Secreted protein [Phytophthora megakarya]
MRRIFNAFPELLMIDCTHKINTWMVMDSFGAGQFVQHSVIEINSDWHLRKVIDHFKSANTTWDNI